jgi:hypothetical protein
MSKAELTAEIQHELAQLERISSVSRDLSLIPASDLRPWHSTAAAKYISDVFHGLENLWKRRCFYLKKPFPDGPHSHAEILSEFLSDSMTGGRLPPDTSSRLKLFKDFRHRFVHGYGFETKWEMVEEPLKLIPETVTALKSVWESWISALPDS